MMGVSHVVSGSIGSRRSNIPANKANTSVENNMVEKTSTNSTVFVNGAKTTGPPSTNGAAMNSNQSAGSRSISRVR